MTITDLRVWLQAQTWWPLDPTEDDPAIPLAVYDPDQIDIAGLNDRAVFLFPSAGPGFLLEQAFDVVAFQFRFRGAQGDYGDVETIAETIDKGIVNGWPTDVGGKRVGKIARVGSAPSFLLRDSARRSHFTGNYLFTVAY